MGYGEKEGISGWGGSHCFEGSPYLGGGRKGGHTGILGGGGGHVEDTGDTRRGFWEGGFPKWGEGGFWGWEWGCP